MRLLLVIFLFFAISSAYAEDIAPPDNAQEETPSLDEYSNVSPGMLMPESDPLKMQMEQDDKPEEGVQEAMTMEDIVAAYRDGKYDSIVKYIVPLAENGHHQAEELLGIMYRSGQGVPKNPEKALLWLNKAAEANRPLAQHHLGVIYFTGDGVQVNPIKSLMWMHIAVLHYADGEEKNRAIQDMDNISARLTRRDKDRALELAREWLDKRGEGHLLDTQ